MEKLLTFQELSVYLGIGEEQLAELIAKGVVSGYQIGGEFLRFRKDQIDAIRPEIDAQVSEKTSISNREKQSKRLERLKGIQKGEDNTFIDRISDFFYFKDFYIISALIIGVLLMVILRDIM